MRGYLVKERGEKRERRILEREKKRDDYITLEIFMNFIILKLFLK